jgi:hypothetical protein
VKPGRDADGVAQTETDHFGNCPVRGALVSPKFAFLLAPGRVGYLLSNKKEGRAGGLLGTCSTGRNAESWQRCEV